MTGLTDKTQEVVFQYGVLGEMILKPEDTLYMWVESGGKDEWFTDHTARKVWDVIKKLHLADKTVDLHTVTAAVEKAHPDVDAYTMQNMVDAAPMGVKGVKHYIDEVRQNYIKQSAKFLTDGFIRGVDESEHPDKDLDNLVLELVGLNTREERKTKEKVVKTLKEQAKNAQEAKRKRAVLMCAAKARAARENGKLGGRPRSAGQPDAEARKRAWETRRNAMKTIVAILLLAVTASAADLTLTTRKGATYNNKKDNGTGGDRVFFRVVRVARFFEKNRLTTPRSGCWIGESMEASTSMEQLIDRMASRHIAKCLDHLGNTIAPAQASSIKRSFRFFADDVKQVIQDQHKEHADDNNPD